MKYEVVDDSLRRPTKALGIAGQLRLGRTLRVPYRYSQGYGLKDLVIHCIVATDDKGGYILWAEKRKP